MIRPMATRTALARNGIRQPHVTKLAPVVADISFATTARRR
ncbi:MAG: hypothetical protein WBF75_14410 [Pseudonocardiaceae bacterium]